MSDDPNVEVEKTEEEKVPLEIVHPMVPPPVPPDDEEVVDEPVDGIYNDEVQDGA